MQHEITKAQPLLNERGELNECGYARSLILDYDRAAIKAPSLRIKEWDYYLITNDDFAIALTIDDNSYMGLVSASVIDFATPCEKTTSVMNAFPNGKTNFPSSSKIGDVSYENKRVKATLANDGKTRHLVMEMKKFDGDKTFRCDITLDNEPRDSMVIATPFKDKPQAFYYNQKIIGMRARGSASVGDKVYDLGENSLGMLDWGRGVWTYKNTWYWGAAQGEINGMPFGFNIGYGFGDTSKASENMLFVDGIAQKLEEVKFGIPTIDGKDDFLSPWTFSSSDGRFEVDFQPIIDRKAIMSVGLIASKQHQVFGKFSGYVILDSGKKLIVKDFLGFAEKVFNKW